MQDFLIWWHVIYIYIYIYMWTCASDTTKMTEASWNKSDVNGRNTIGCLDQNTTPNNQYIVTLEPPSSHNPTAQPKKYFFPMEHPKLSQHETVALWNSIWQKAVPMYVPRIVSLLPQAFKSHLVHVDGVIWKPAMFSLRKASGWSHWIYTKTQFGIGFEIKKWRTGSIKSQINRIKTVLRCISGPNLEILASISSESWLGEAQNEVNFDFEVSVWHWGSRSFAQQNNEDLIQCLVCLWSKFGDPNLIGWCVFAQTSSGVTDRQTDRQTDKHTDR